jgi:hypothetical protein
MRLWIAPLAATAALLSSPALADTVCEWMEFAQAVQTAAAPPPTAPRVPDHDRAQTQVALAMFEALNAIDRRYESYLGFGEADSTASQDAAAATAAYEVLLSHFPSQKATLDDSYAVTINEIGDKRARDSGVAIGKAAAALALKAGGVDPAMVQTPYLPRTQPGVWVPTQLPVFTPFSTAFKPWILERADSVRPGPPPALDSETWVRDYAEVKRLGGKASKDRTPHETLMARYRITPNMMPSYRMAADAPGRRAVENARMFAMVNMIYDDNLMAVGDAKLHYNFWRPVTAIRNGELDGSPATEPDKGWEPLINTPNHPEYPCGHCILAAGGAEFMKAEVGPKPTWGIRVSSLSIPNAAVQVLPSWDEWVRQVSYSRTLGGVHYRFSNVVAEEMGRRVAQMAMAKIMRPLPKAAAKKKR